MPVEEQLQNGFQLKHSRYLIGFFVRIMIVIFIPWVYTNCQERRLQNRRKPNRTNFVRAHNVNEAVPQLHFERGDNA